jgi:hypothetical protein
MHTLARQCLAFHSSYLTNCCFMLNCESDVEFPEVVFHDSWTGRLLFRLLESGKARLNFIVNQQKVHVL